MPYPSGFTFPGPGVYPGAGLLDESPHLRQPTDVFIFDEEFVTGVILVPPISKVDVVELFSRAAINDKDTEAVLFGADFFTGVDVTVNEPGVDPWQIVDGLIPSEDLVPEDDLIPSATYVPGESNTGVVFE